jgi:manganese transport protein
VAGPQDLVSNSVIGASYGYAALWTLVLILAARFVILEASSRYVLTTGESLFTGLARVGRWVVWLILSFLVLKRHLSNLFLILLLGECANLLAPLPVRSGPRIWALLLWAVAFAFMFRGRYRAVERASLPLAVLVGGTFVTVALLSKPDLAAVAQGLFVPTIPPDQGTYRYLFLVMALAGSSAGTVGNLKYAVFVHEKGWRDRSWLKRRRLDLLLGVTALFAMAALMQMAAAAVLQPRGMAVRSVQDLVPLFSLALGPVARIALGLGITAVVFNTFVGSNTGYSIMLSDIYYGSVRRAKAAEAPTGADKKQCSLPAYRWFLTWFCVSPLYVLLTDWQPILIILITTALSLALLPVLTAALLRLTADRRLMGEYANRRGTNAALVLIAVAAVLLTFQNSLDFWTRDLAGFFGAM